jgi:hypothetical protein
LGSFTLSYPEFEPAHKIIEVKAVAASAMLRYEGGAQCVVSAGKDEDRDRLQRRACGCEVVEDDDADRHRLCEGRLVADR